MSVKGLANAFLQRGFNDEILITHMKLQKLSYLGYGYFLAVTGGNHILIPDKYEKFYAWRYGPVSPVLYDEFKEFGSKYITREAKEKTYLNGKCYEIVTPSVDEYHDSRITEVINQVWRIYRTWTAHELSALTHQPGLAWDRVMQENGFDSSPLIPDQAIMQDFEAMVENNRVDN